MDEEVQVSQERTHGERMVLNKAKQVADDLLVEHVVVVLVVVNAPHEVD